MKYEQSRLFCVCCGKEGIPIQRQRGKQRETGHRKVLYCINCKKSVNHVECKTDEDVLDFKMAYAAGAYADEAEIETKGSW